MNALCLRRQHPFFRMSHLTIVRLQSLPAWILAFAAWSAGLCAPAALPGVSRAESLTLAAQSQETRPSAIPPAGQTPAPEKNEKKKKHSHEHDFLLIGTVFTEKGFSLEGAELHVRRASEKKFRWEARTDRRGEFAVRVQQGADYKLIVRAPGYQEQMRAVDAKSGDREDLVFRLAPAEGKSK